MSNTKQAIILTIGILIIASSIPASNAELWDLIILADLENGTILPGQTPVITGVIVDHASKPVQLAQVHIRSGQESVFTVTDEHGSFSAILSNFNRIPGTYIVNIVGTSPDGKTGITTTEFQVKGELTRTSILEQQLSSFEAQKYLGANEGDFEKDPIGFTLFHYYQKLYQEYLVEVAADKQLTEKQLRIEAQKAIADELTKQAIEEFNPKYGVFSGYKYDDYINNLNPEIKDTIINQLNFTKNLFEEAQKIKEEILSNGGTEQDARQAYLEKITMTKDSLESFGLDTVVVEQNSTSNEVVEEEQSTTEQTADEKILNVNIEGTDIKVNTDGRSIFVNVNGTIIEFFVNGTGIYQVN